ncbi:MAG: chromate transporter [Bacilli bacterium]|jgi:chromate transporter
MSYFRLLLLLFYTFFKVGLFTIGGGYAMIPLIISEVQKHGWISLDELLDFIGISEITPGPFAINITTFVGATTAGVPGAIVATIAVVLPSFIIILLIAKYFQKFLETNFVKAMLRGVKPVIVALIFASGVFLLYQLFGPFQNANSPFNLRNFTLFINMAIVFIAYKKIYKKTFHPIALIFLGAFCGIIVYFL